ncbi:endonuclease V [Chryseobacterium echinoideorum]|uniref:endonuclease V n=1 Tax=Chryseobacterium echinoideorum TaxID=1549648 RepID=UPI0016288F86|nr:endonuclease V [Chryseobacterium echinoideorum]
MIYAFDTYYYENFAKTVCIAFENWNSEEEAAVYTENIAITADYESGAFYKRELPCILHLLKKINLNKGDIILVDGYVSLNSDGKLGLGGYLFKELDEKYPVVGIAKNKFSQDDFNRIEVYRGESKTPLYLTVAGTDILEIKLKIEEMQGEFRIPALLKKLDQLTRIT